MKKFFGVIGLLTLSGCGVSNNMDKGPVVLQCDGEEVDTPYNRSSDREYKRVIYRVDGKNHTLEKWNDEGDRYDILTANGFFVDQAVAVYNENKINGNGYDLIKISFDRLSGHIQDEIIKTSNETIKFIAQCKPINGPPFETKF